MDDLNGLCKCSESPHTHACRNNKGFFSPACEVRGTDIRLVRLDMRNGIMVSYYHASVIKHLQPFVCYSSSNNSALKKFTKKGDRRAKEHLSPPQATWPITPHHLLHAYVIKSSSTRNLSIKLVYRLSFFLLLIFLILRIFECLLSDNLLLL